MNSAHGCTPEPSFFRQVYPVRVFRTKHRLKGNFLFPAVCESAKLFFFLQEIIGQNFSAKQITTDSCFSIFSTTGPEMLTKQFDCGRGTQLTRQLSMLKRDHTSRPNKINPRSASTAAARVTAARANWIKLYTGAHSLISSQLTTLLQQHGRIFSTDSAAASTIAGLCIITIFCAVLHVRQEDAEAVGDSCMLCALGMACGLGFILGPIVRGKIRERQGIDGSFIGDFCVWFFCGLCALIQEGQEVKSFAMKGQSVERE
uniref:MFS domain-containing protein n=1 Tax=Macrostomum lignano TaxID=282301 RepID=A0A1I8F859_9PLAT